jgi:hypothetical protein
MSARAKRQSDTAYVAALDREIADQTAQLRAQLQSQIEELRARVAQSTAQSDEKKVLVDRQNKMVARDAASQDMVSRPYSNIPQRSITPTPRAPRCARRSRSSMP